MLLLLKVLRFLWPFVKEMILGEKTLKQAIKSNKIKVLCLFMVFLSLALNFFTIPKLILITKNHLEYVKKYTPVKKPDSNQKKPDTPPAAGGPPPARSQPYEPGEPLVLPTPPRTPRRPTTVAHIDYERAKQIQQRFDEIKRQEEAAME